MLHPYRSHHCEALRATDIGQTVRLSGWIHRKRDHGGVVFIDLRDHYGLTQCVADSTDAAFAGAEDARNETVVTITGKVRARSEDTVNATLPTGEIEVHIEISSFSLLLKHCLCRSILMRILVKSKA